MSGDRDPRDKRRLVGRDVHETKAAPAGLIERVSGGSYELPVSFEEDYTGRYEGEELARMRARRPTDKRFERMEKKHDEFVARTDRKHEELVASVNNIAVSHGTMTGQLKTLVELAGASAVEREKRAAADAAAEAAESAAADAAASAATKERERVELAAAAERERKRKYIVPIITALGVIIVGVVVAILGSMGK